MNLSKKMQEMQKPQDVATTFICFFSLFLFGIALFIIAILAIKNGEEIPSPVFIFILIAMFPITAILFLKERLSIWKRDKETSQRMLLRYEKIIPQIDEELNHPSTIYLKQMKLYMTQNYMISYANGLEIIPWETIVNVRRECPSSYYHHLLVEDFFEEKHELGHVKNNPEGEQLFAQVIQVLKDRLQIAEQSAE